MHQQHARKKNSGRQGKKKRTNISCRLTNVNPAERMHATVILHLCSLPFKFLGDMQGKLCGKKKTCSRGYTLRTHGDFSNICFIKRKKVFKKVCFTRSKN